MRDGSMKCFKYTFSYLKFFFIFLVSGCTGINIHQVVVLSGDDWVMSGGNTEQQYRSKSIISPQFQLLWTYNCDAGFGPSCVSAADAMVFVNTLQGEMHCVDISSGGKIGQLNFLGKEASTTPSIDENKLILAFAGDNRRSLVCYDMLNGMNIWRINIGYLQTSPILSDNYIYIGSLDGKEYKISKLNGSIIWDYNTRSQIHSTAALYDNKVVFGADNGYIYCINTDGGSEFWKYKTDGSVITTPMIFDKKVFIGSFDSNYYCLDVDSGKVIWKQDLKTRMTAGSTLFDSNTVIFGGVDGILYALNTSNGEIKWKFPTKAVITSTPLSAGDYVYFSSHDWHIYCLNGYDGKELWNYELDGRGKTSPVIWSNFLFVTADKYLYCFEGNKK
jgi:outer membrane protein assembly factor BamB